MSKRYTGGVVSSSLPTVNAAGASGVFTLNQQSAAQSTNNWPPYKIEESLRFRVSAGAYLNRTPSSAGNRQRWTWSAWVKRGSPSFNTLFAAYQPAPRQYIAFYNNQLYAYGTSSGTDFVECSTTEVFRDFAAWYHIVFVYDTTQATGSNRVKIYVNGVQQTLTFTTTPSQNSNGAINGVWGHFIGAQDTPYPDMDGYMSEVNFVDGQALTPSSFGATDKDGNWSPIAYTGTYGTNGFYVNFRDNTSATTMGYDYSGNGNNWTLNGFNVSTANTTYDIMIDVPEDQSDGTANNRGNYATLNPISRVSTVASVATITNGNLDISTTTSDTRSYATFGFPTSGKYYYELTNNNSGSKGQGIASYDAGGDTYQVLYFGSGNKQIDGTSSAYGASYTTNDVIGVAVDIDSNQVTFYKNNTSQGAISYTFSGKPTMFPYVRREASTDASYSFNFGQRPFVYTPPAGFVALNTFNLPDPTIKQPNKHFDALLWTGDGNNSRNITGYGFSPEFLWIKKRSGAEDHKLNDIVRGVDKQLMSNRTEPEYTNTDQVRAFLSNGFTTDGSGSTNGNGATYVGWAWNAGGSTVTNTAGSITSQVRANPTAGFSIVTYTGTGSNATVGHGLGVAPSMVIVKNRGGVYSWLVYHKFMAASSPATWYMSLNGTAAASNGANVWIDDPTSTVFTISGSYPEVNGSTNTYVAYCFAPIAGYSAFGSYTGNGSSDGPFIFTGFRPRFVMIKRTDAVQQWWITDTARNPSNTCNLDLFANLSNAEENNGYNLDLLSNGVKIKTSTNDRNASSGTYIYMAFAEMPFKYARAR